MLIEPGEEDVVTSVRTKQKLFFSKKLTKPSPVSYMLSFLASLRNEKERLLQV